MIGSSVQLPGCPGIGWRIARWAKWLRGGEIVPMPDQGFEQTHAGASPEHLLEAARYAQLTSAVAAATRFPAPVENRGARGGAPELMSGFTSPASFPAIIADDRAVNETRALIEGEEQ
jgi:hypothetical protein